MDFLEPLFFGFFAVAVLGSALGVVLARKITTSALFMAFSFLNMAGIFVLLGSETIAAFQVLIYVGAITVLILFGVMLTPQAPQSYGLFFQGQTRWGALLAALAALPLIVIAFGFRDGEQPLEAGGDLEALGRSIFTQFVFPFEMAGVLLLAAIVGAIVLVQRENGLERDRAASQRRTPWKPK